MTANIGNLVVVYRGYLVEFGKSHYGLIVVAAIANYTLRGVVCLFEKGAAVV